MIDNNNSLYKYNLHTLLVVFFFPSQGDYQKTLEYFSKCYTYCQQLNDSAAIQSAQVQYGIALTHYRMEQFTSAIDNVSDKGVMRLVNWKGKRVMPEEEEEEGGGGGKEEEIEQKSLEESDNIKESAEVRGEDDAVDDKDTSIDVDETTVQ